MKSLLDHDVPEDLTYLLQELGHEVLRLRDVLPQEAADLVVRQFADQYSCGGRGRVPFARLKFPAWAALRLDMIEPGRVREAGGLRT